MMSSSGVGLRQHRAVRRDDQGIPAEHLLSCDAAAVAGHHIHLVFDGPRAQQGYPVFTARQRPFRADEQRLRPAHGQLADQLAETDVVADGRRAAHASEFKPQRLLPLRKVSVLVHQPEQMNLVIPRAA